VHAGGFLFSLLGFLLFPLVWSIPEALITAELGSTFPDSSGGVAWVEEAFGARAGFFSGYFSWVSGATDNAIYPVLFLEYLLQHISGNDDAFEGMNRLIRFFILSSTAVILAYLNYLGLEIVGKMSIVICIISMSPFIIMVLIGIPKVDPSRWFELPEEGASSGKAGWEDSGWLPLANVWGVLWRPLLNNLFWNLNSFDSGANFSGDTRDPGKNFPRGMFYSVILVVFSYFIPLLIAIGATDNKQSDWVDGYLAVAISEIGGRWLGAWTVFASGISNLALFQAEMSTDALGIMGMAERGMLPKIFATKSPHGTPTYGILLGTLVIVGMSVADFRDIIEMLNFTYAISLLMEYAAFIKLRITRKEVYRPYRVPLNTAGCIAMVIPPCIVTILLMLMASFMTYIYFAVSVLLGIVLRCAHVKRSNSRLDQSECNDQSVEDTGSDDAEDESFVIS